MQASLSPAAVRAGLTGLAVVWGTQFLVTKWALGELPPLQLGALRFAVVAALAHAALARRPSPAPPLPPQRALRALYGLSHAAAVSLLYWGQARTDSAVAAALSATSPVLLAFLAPALLPDERPSWAVRAGAGVGLCGAVAMLAGAVELGAATVAGSVAVAASAACSVATKLSARRLTSQLPTALLLRDLGLWVALPLGAASLVLEPLRLPSWPAIAAVTWLAVVGSWAATGVYLRLLRQIEVSRMGYLQFAHTAIALLVGVVLAGERPSWLQLGGALVIVLGGLGVVRGGGPTQAQEATRVRSNAD